MSNLVKWVKELELPQHGVVHIGAHQAQEGPDYSVNSLEPVLWVEAIPSLALRARKNLNQYPSQVVLEAALWSESGIRMNFNVSSNDGGSSSFFEFHLHSASYPDVATTSILEMETRTLSEILSGPIEIEKSFGYLVLDVQGAELEVLRGGADDLSDFIGIVSEVSLRELYKGAPLLEELVSWLSAREFRLIACDVSSQTGWGDAFFVRSDIVAKLGLSPLEPKDISKSQHLTFPTLVRIFMIKIRVNPMYFSRSFLFGRKR